MGKEKRTNVDAFILNNNFLETVKSESHAYYASYKVNGKVTMHVIRKHHCNFGQGRNQLKMMVSGPCLLYSVMFATIVYEHSLRIKILMEVLLIDSTRPVYIDNGM